MKTIARRIILMACAVVVVLFALRPAKASARRATDEELRSAIGGYNSGKCCKSTGTKCAGTSVITNPECVQTTQYDPVKQVDLYTGCSNATFGQACSQKTLLPDYEYNCDTPLNNSQCGTTSIACETWQGGTNAVCYNYTPALPPINWNTYCYCGPITNSNDYGSRTVCKGGSSMCP